MNRYTYVQMSNATQNKMREVREKLNLTQEEMGKKIGCSTMTVRRSEYQARLPQTGAVLVNFRKLAKQAGVEIDSGAAASA